MVAVGRAAAIKSVQKVEDDQKAKLRSKAGHDPRLKKKKVKKLTDADLGFTSVHQKFTKANMRLRDNKLFQTSIIGVIFLAGIVVGIQTYPPQSSLVPILGAIDTCILVIFIVEVFVKLWAEGKTPYKFFLDGWNAFDFIIVVVSLLPFGGGAVTALRLVRLLRVLKLVRALPKLRILVMGLLKSLSSIAYIGLLLLLLFYLYAVLGLSMFQLNDPVHFDTLHIAFVTLFRCATLEDWTDVMYINMYGCEEYGYGGMEDRCTQSERSPLLSIIYFCSFVILSAMMILNLFIGVITSSMQDAKSDLTDEMNAELAEVEAAAVAAEAAEGGEEGAGADEGGEDEEEEEDAEDEDEDDDDAQLELRLEELSELMSKIQAEIDYFAVMERERRGVSGKKVGPMSAGDVLSMLKGGAFNTTGGAPATPNVVVSSITVNGPEQPGSAAAAEQKTPRFALGAAMAKSLAMKGAAEEAENERTTTGGDIGGESDLVNSADHDEGDDKKEGTTDSLSAGGGVGSSGAGDSKESEPAPITDDVVVVEDGVSAGSIIPPTTIGGDLVTSVGGTQAAVAEQHRRESDQLDLEAAGRLVGIP